MSDYKIILRDGKGKTTEKKTIAIIGAGMVGQAAARALGQLGHDVRLANSRGKKHVSYVASAWGATPVDVSEAAKGADIVILAIPYPIRDEVLTTLQAAPGTIIVDPTNYWEPRDGEAFEPKPGEATTWSVAKRWPSLRFVKTLNLLFFELLKELARPDLPDAERSAIPIAADDAEAKRAVARLLREMGFAAVDCGPLSTSHCMSHGSSLFSWCMDLGKAPDVPTAFEHLKKNGISAKLALDKVS
jgi:predicted dinucleotide-binding enzyme